MGQGSRVAGGGGGPGGDQLSEVLADLHRQGAGASLLPIAGQQGASAAPVAALATELYRHEYSRPNQAGLMQASSNDRCESLGVAAYRDALAVANQSRDGWHAGWQIRELRGSGAAEITDGRRTYDAVSTDYAPMFGADLGPHRGQPVLLRWRRGSTTMQAGTYYVFGETIPASNHSEIRRIYCNMSPHVTIGMVKQLTGDLNTARVPFTLKTMLEPADRDRADATVLYVRADSFDVVIDCIRALPSWLRARLTPAVPLFTHEVIPGIGWASEPSTGESFGMHRCRLVAEALIASAGGTLCGLIERAHQTFRHAGVDPREPHLDAPSAVPGDAILRVVGHRPVQQATGHQSPAPMPLVADLRARGLVHADQLVIKQLTRRNTNVAFVEPDGSGVLVKELRVAGAESRAMMQREADIYQWFASWHPGHDDAQGYLVDFFAFDERNGRLLLNFEAGSENLSQYAARSGGAGSDVAAGTGRMLAQFHNDSQGKSLPFPSREPAGILTAHQGGSLQRWLGPGQRLFVADATRPAEVANELDRLAATWPTECLIHGDIKWDNILWCPSLSPTLKLVDWELADIGDPCWDVAAAMHSWVGPGIFDDQLLVNLRSLWSAYIGERSHEMEPGERDSQLSRTVQLCGARLLQAGIEAMAGDPAPTKLALRYLAAGQELIVNPARLSADLETAAA